MTSSTTSMTSFNLPKDEKDARSKDFQKQNSSTTIKQRFCSKMFDTHSTDLNSSILPLFYVSKILGLTCVTIKTENGRVCYQQSSFGFVYNIFVSILTFISMIYVNIHIHNSNTYIINDYSCIMILNSTFKVCAPLLLSLASLLSALKQKEILSCIQNLEDTDAILSRFNIHIPYQSNRRFLITLIVTGAFVITLLIVTDTILSANTKATFDTPSVVSYVLPKFLNYVSECQFLGWTWSLRQRHRLLNGRLESGHHDAALVPALSAAHASLGAIAEDVNNLFALQLLVRISFYFVDILTSSFFAIQTVPHLVARDIVPSYFVLCVLYWTFWVITELVVICTACSSLQKEATRTGIIVHAVQRKTTNPCIKEQLQMFSSQLLHQKVGFTACGLFAVDLRLVHAVIGTVTTYLVILVQFDSEYTRLAMIEQNVTTVKQ